MVELDDTELDVADLAEHPATMGLSSQAQYDIQTCTALRAVATTPNNTAKPSPNTTHQVDQRELLRLSDQRSMRVIGAGFSISFQSTSSRSPQ